MHRFPRVPLLVLLISSIAAAGNFADYIPGDALFYAGVESVARTRERARKSPLLAMWNAPEMEGMRQGAERLGKKGAEQTIRASEFAKLLQGEFCVAIVPLGRSDSTTVVLIDLKGNRPAILDMLERARSRDDGEGVRKEQEDYRGYTITTYRELVEGRDDPATTYTFIKDNFYGHCADLAVAKDIIARKEAGEKTGLSSRTTFQKVMAATGERSDARSDARFYVTSRSWLRELGTGTGGLIVRALGLGGVRSIGGQLTLSERGVSIRTLIQNEAEPSGVLKLLGGNVEHLVAPALIPADAGQSITLALDWQLLLDEVRKLGALIDPATLKQIVDRVTETEKELGVSLRDDLFAAFAPGFTFSFLTSPPGEEQTESEDMADGWAQLMRSAVAFQTLRDKEKVGNLLARLARREAAPFKQVRYLGTTIFDGDDAGLPSVAIVGNQLIIAGAPGSLRTLIRRHGKELDGIRDTPTYKRALALVPVRRSFLFVDPVDSESEGWALIPQLHRDSPEKLGAEFFAAAPDATFFNRYQDATVIALSTEEHGLLITTFLDLRTPNADSEDSENGADSTSGAESDE